MHLKTTVKAGPSWEDFCWGFDRGGLDDSETPDWSLLRMKKDTSFMCGGACFVVGKGIAGIVADQCVHPTYSSKIVEIVLFDGLTFNFTCHPFPIFFPFPMASASQIDGNIADLGGAFWEGWPEKKNPPVFTKRRFVAGFFRRLLAYLTPHIFHTYPFQTYPTNTYPTNTYPTNTYPFNTYPTNTYPCDAYPFNAYPFKRCASAGIANVSHQYISHQYLSVHNTYIPPVRIHSMRIHSKGLHQQVLLLGGNGNERRNFAFSAISLQLY